MQIKTVGGAKRASWERKVEDEETAVVAKDAGHFRQGTVPIRLLRRPNATVADRTIRFGTEVEARRPYGVFHAFAASDFEHLRREIRRDDLRGGQSSPKGKGEVAAPGRQVEDLARLPLATIFDARRRRENPRHR